MLRLVLMLVAAVVIPFADGTAHPNIAIQTFSVPAGAGPQDVYPAPEGAVWFTAIRRQAGSARSEDRQVRFDFSGTGWGATWGDRRA